MKTSNHPSIREGHPRSLKNIQGIRSQPQPFTLIPRPTRRYMKRLALSYLYCPDCESKNITYYGKSSVGTQKHQCKDCHYQFVLQYDALFPRSRRREMFEREFMNNLQRHAFKEGTGRKEYWENALPLTLMMLESQTMRVRMNRIIKQSPVRGELDYRLLLKFAVREAYMLVMA